MRDGVTYVALYNMSCLHTAIPTRSFCGFWHGHPYIPLHFLKMFSVLVIYGPGSPLQEDVTPLAYFDSNAIELERRIGRGNASVFRATMGGKAMAVKKMVCRKKEVPREVEVHSKLPPHPNILPLLGIAHDDDTILICMELADKSLYQYLHTEKKKPSLQQSINLAMQIARGMHHIHQHGLVHRDLKSANVLLFEAEDVAKVCDFGSARVLEHTATVTGMPGTYRWMAPEFSSKETTKANQLCDVFSYGMILYEIFAQEVPFADIDDGVAVTRRIREGQRPSIPSEVPNNIQMLMKFCWMERPNDRPTFERILQVARFNLCTEKSHEAENKKLSTIYIYVWEIKHKTRWHYYVPSGLVLYHFHYVPYLGMIYVICVTFPSNSEGFFSNVYLS